MKVTIVKRYDREFRLPLYALLKDKLEKKGIDFELIIGQLNKYEEPNIKDVFKNNPFGPIVENKYLYFREHSFSFQNVLNKLSDSNLIIVQQSNAEILNYLLLLKRKLGGKFKLAFWGHGINFQTKNKNSLPQKFKLFVTKGTDHFFAYNKLTYEILVSNSYPKEKITILNNTIDVSNEKKIYDSIKESEINKIRTKYGIKGNDKVGIFCGSLYKLKRIDFLLESLGFIKKKFPNFHFFVLGDGELKNIIVEYEKENGKWFHYVGFKSGFDKQLYLKLSDVQLIPSSVGLNVIDSFYTETPLVTITDSNHGPEIIYLENEKNGVLTNDNVNDYSESVINILRDEEKLTVLKKGCEQSAKIYTIENMAENFYQGIIKTLGVQ